MSGQPHDRPSELFSACETLALFLNGEMSPVEFMRTTLDRCASINKRINAVARYESPPRFAEWWASRPASGAYQKSRHTTPTHIVTTAT